MINDHIADLGHGNLELPQKEEDREDEHRTRAEWEGLVGQPRVDVDGGHAFH